MARQLPMLSTTTTSMVSGTPGATVDDEPKLDRMSRRTMPFCDKTLGPFDPSPGKGPAVSSGMGAQSAVPAAVAEAPTVDVVEPAPEVDVVDPAGVEPAEVEPSGLHPASTPSADPASSRRARRRLSVARSNCRPRS